MKFYLVDFQRSNYGVTHLLKQKMKNEDIYTDDYQEADYIIAMGDRHDVYDFTLDRFRDQYPIIHLWAGEISQGCHDEVYRHSITLMSELQLCTHELAKNRVEALCKAVDKEPNAHVIGNLFIDDLTIDESKVPDEPYNLVLYNPPTKLNVKQVVIDLTIIKNLVGDSGYIWIESNKDRWKDLIEEYTNHDTLPRPQFLGLLKNCRYFISNSTATIYEAPLFLKPDQIIHIGERNKERECKKADLTIGNASDNIIRVLKECCQ